LGSDTFTKTEIKVGVNPKVLQQFTELDEMKRQIAEELGTVNKDVTTLTVQKKNFGNQLPDDKQELLTKLQARQQKLTARDAEISLELEELRAYLDMLEQSGKVCAEKTAFPGVEIYIKDNRFPVKDPYNFVKFSLEGGDIRLSEYDPPEDVDAKHKKYKRRD